MGEGDEEELGVRSEVEHVNQPEFMGSRKFPGIGTCLDSLGLL